MSPRHLIFTALIVILSGCQVELFHALPEDEANRVYRELERSGIEVKKSLSDKRKKLFSIEVPRGSATKALEVLRSADLPRKSHEGFGLVTDGGGIIPSPRQQRIKYYIALAGELEQTLENLPGVQYARVHFAMPEGSGILTSTEDRQPPQRAAVVLKVQEKLFQLTPKDVQSLVAGSLPKIAPEAVSVVVQLAPPVTPGKGGYTTLGPFTVSPSTKVPLLITFALLILLVIGLVTIVVLSRRALARLRAGGDGVDDGPTVTT